MFLNYAMILFIYNTITDLIIEKMQKEIHPPYVLYYIFTSDRNTMYSSGTIQVPLLGVK